MITYFPPSNGYLGKPPTKSLEKFTVIDKVPQLTHRIVVHKFQLRDLDDPDIYAAQPLWEWESSEEGKWIMKNSLETPQWHRRDDPMSFKIEYAITAVLKDVDYMIWLLKFK